MSYTLVTAAIVALSNSGCSKGTSMFGYPAKDRITHIEVSIFENAELKLEAAKYRLNKSEWDRILYYMTPASEFTGTLSDKIDPIVSQIEIVEVDGTAKQYWIRWMGSNPLLVSNDGVHYYWGQQPTGVADNDVALTFISIVREHGTRRK